MPDINQQIINTMLDLVLICDREGNLVRVSPSCEMILGYKPEEMAGHSAREFLYPPDLDATRREMRRSRRGAETRHFECRYVHKDGHIATLLWTGVWVPDEQCHFFIGRDVTQIRADEVLKTVQGMLGSINTNMAQARDLLVLRRFDAVAIEVLLMFNSVWASHILVTRPLLFETYRATFTIPMLIMDQEWSWGILAAVAALLKALGIALSMHRLFSPPSIASRTCRIAGLLGSAALWSLFGFSAIIGNPDSLFGMSGAIMSVFAVWSLVRLVRR